MGGIFLLWSLVGARPLHLAYARPFGCLKVPLGLLLLRKRGPTPNPAHSSRPAARTATACRVYITSPRSYRTDRRHNDQNECSTYPPINSQHHDTPNNKTHFIKFRVTEIEHTAKLLNLSLSTLIRRALHNVKIEKTIIVASSGEETLTAVSTLLAQCSKVGGNLNQLATHFNSGGADTEQIRAKNLDELADLTAFRLNAEKVLGELYGNAQAYQLSRKAGHFARPKQHICDIQFDVVANDLNNRIVIKTRTTLPLKCTSFTSMTSSLESNFWMNTASRSCENRTCSTRLSVASSRLQRPVCRQTARIYFLSALTPMGTTIRETSTSTS